MKKAALTFGLFSLVMVATSFATPETSNGTSLETTIQGGIARQNSEVDPSGGNVVGKNKKRDDFQLVTIRETNNVDPSGGNVVGKNKKLD
ncbi:3-oxoacyl-ACP reductase [Flavobacterium sp. FlaQc-48]|uniref:3-oxoacyl-ACP reductase n=1 Tax=Flavobacterium sp. FlaQc-48 TaxID=3374181 RepID=UPI003757A671